MAACIKHFPGDGVDERDQHLLPIVNSLSCGEWEETYGRIYRTLIGKGAQTVMVGHILQPAMTRKFAPDIRDEDYASMRAGLDKGIITPRRLDEAVSRVLALKASLGLHKKQKAGRLVPDQSALSALGCAEHQAWARECADKAVTLVKDNQGLLPLSPKKTPRIRLAVLGEDQEGAFGDNGLIGPALQAALEAEGFQVSVFDRATLEHGEIFEAGVKDLKKKFDLSLVAANVPTGSNNTTRRVDWITLMAADEPWYMKEIPTMFISFCNPYHMVDVPFISTFVNCYSSNEASVAAAVEKMMGRSAFRGVSPVDPWCGGDCAFRHGGSYVYYKTFHAPEAWANETVTLKFEGVYQKTAVYVNSQPAERCAYGYTEFYVNLNDYLRYGADNTVRVLVRTGDQPNSRWYSGSGIYRDVYLLTGGLSHIAPGGAVAACERTGVFIKGGGSETVPQRILIPGARLWSEDSPALYTGRTVKLRGACIHHDSGLLGAATYEAAEYRRIRLLKEAGFNAVRCAHNPASPALLRACDALGVYVMDEAFDMWTRAKTDHDYARHRDPSHRVPAA